MVAGPDGLRVACCVLRAVDMKVIGVVMLYIHYRLLVLILEQVGLVFQRHQAASCPLQVKEAELEDHNCSNHTFTMQRYNTREIEVVLAYTSHALWGLESCCVTMEGML